LPGVVVVVDSGKENTKQSASDMLPMDFDSFFFFVLVVVVVVVVGNERDAVKLYIPGV
jgi:hypothetical protein